MALSPKKSRNLARGISLALSLIIVAAQFGLLPGLGTLYQRLELLVYDQRMQAYLPEKVEKDRRVIIVDIDEESLHRVGRWPWSRNDIAGLLYELTQVGAVVIAFDVLFAEPERNPALEILQRLDDPEGPFAQGLASLAPALDADAVLADQLAQSEAILGYAFDPVNKAGSGELPPPLPLIHPDIVPQLPLESAPGYSAPVPLLQLSAIGGGFFTIRPDIDGVVRRAALVSRYDDNLYAALSLEAVRRFMFLEKVELVTADIGGEQHIEFIRLAEAVNIPTDGYGRMLIPYRGKAGSFPYVPAYKVLSGEADPELFAGSIVLVGTSAAGLFDLRATPVGAVYPGVEVHANLIASMLDNRYLNEPSWADGANLVFGVVVGLLLSIFMPRMPLLWLIALATGAVGSVVAVTGWFWTEQGLVLNLAGPLLLLLVLTFFNLTWGFFFESLRRHRLKDSFGQYVPPELVDQMSEHPDAFGLDGRARELTVLFSDIRGFTTISESLSADELKQFLNRFFTPMTRIIFNHRGTIDKYVGDMVMAFWGAPVTDERHAVHAIEAALDMLVEVERIKPEFERQGWPEVNIGIGINSGQMSVGDMGSEYRRSYTVLGDAVNLGSRLEGATKYYGVMLIVGERTRELAGDHFVYRELDLVKVKGKEQAIRVFEPICRRSEADDGLLQEISLLDDAIKAYRRRQWERAKERFEQLQGIRPGFHLYALYLERIAELRTHGLNEGWDGVYVRKDK